MPLAWCNPQGCVNRELLKMNQQARLTVELLKQEILRKEKQIVAFVYAAEDYHQLNTAVFDGISLNEIMPQR
jgi:hypothetical protein